MSIFHIDSLLREALVISGCTDTQIGSFDGYSTIELRLEQLPTLNIGRLDNDFWFWSELSGISDMRMLHHSEALLRFLMHRRCFARTEQMQLVNSNDQLELRVLLADSALVDAKALANALNMYMAALKEICHLFRE